jgi:hypothetical protein
MISDLCKDVGQIDMRIDAVHLAGLCDAVDTGGALAASVGATEEIVLSAQNRGPHRALGGSKPLGIFDLRSRTYQLVQINDDAKVVLVGGLPE